MLLRLYIRFLTANVVATATERIPQTSFLNHSFIHTVFFQNYRMTVWLLCLCMGMAWVPTIPRWFLPSKINSMVAWSARSTLETISILILVEKVKSYKRVFFNLSFFQSKFTWNFGQLIRYAIEIIKCMIMSKVWRHTKLFLPLKYHFEWHTNDYYLEWCGSVL